MLLKKQDAVTESPDRRHPYTLNESKQNTTIMTKAIITISGFILLLCVGSIEPEHWHTIGTIESTNMSGVEVEYCVTTDTILIEGEHKHTSYRIKYD